MVRISPKHDICAGANLMPLSRILDNWMTVTDEEVELAKQIMGLGSHRIRGGMQIPNPREDARVAAIFQKWNEFSTDIPPYPDGTRSAESRKAHILDLEKTCIGFVVWMKPNKVWVVMYE